MSEANHSSLQKKLIDELSVWLREHHAEPVEMIETHVSYILLQAQTAWKIKKSIHLPFLDYSTLALRQQYCQKEYQLSKQYAPKIYRAVRSLYKNDQTFNFAEEGNWVETMIEMERFQQEDLLSHRVKTQGLSRSDTIAMAECIADFHLSCPPCSNQTRGNIQLTGQEMSDNFTALRDNPLVEPVREKLDETQKRGEQALADFKDLIQSRAENGWVRNCHGDLHLGNIVWLEQKPVLFDRIEFNDEFSQVDVIKDMAFLYMDLFAHQKGVNANLLFNRWVQRTHDYEGLALLNLYASYRAMVRAKIAAIECQQDPANKQAQQALIDKIHLAWQFLQPKKQLLVLMHGCTGSGKTYYAEQIAGALNAVILNSDIIRKKTLGVGLERISDTKKLKKVYSDDANEITYQTLLKHTKALLRAGHHVVVDASFTQAKSRAPFLACAKELNIETRIVSPIIDEERLMENLDWRETTGDISDGNLMVWQKQNKNAEPLDAKERAIEIKIETNYPLDLKPYQARNPLHQPEA